MVEAKEGTNVTLLSNSRGEAHEHDHATDAAACKPSSFRAMVAFWLLGLINNSSYVIMMAVAKDIAPGAVGVVFLADVAPTMLIKVTAPYWFHLVPYGVRVCGCAFLMVLALVTIGYGKSTAVQLLGVCFSSLQGGLGEASFLALASFYDTPRALTAWSSGTGFAGIFGYAWVVLMKFSLGLSFRATLMTANVLVLFWLYTYFTILMKYPFPLGYENGRASSNTISEECTEPYSTLDSPQSTSSPALNDNGRYICIAEIEGKEPTGHSEASDGQSSRDELGEMGPSRAAQMTTVERLRFILSLWRFTVPLMLVYFAEYTMQTGTWSAIGFPVTSASARQHFYEYANWSYQGGVFISRSSGMIFRLSTLSLWSLPFLQLLLLFFFYLIAVEHFWYDNTLLFLCFGVGLIGGLGYVNAFRLVAEAVPSDLTELALASASVGDSFGVMFSDIFGTFVQACVYKRNGIPGAWATC